MVTEADCKAGEFGDSKFGEGVIPHHLDFQRKTGDGLLAMGELVMTWLSSAGSELGGEI